MENTTPRKRMFCTWTDSVEAWKKNQAYQKEQQKKKEEEEEDYQRVKEAIFRRSIA